MKKTIDRIARWVRGLFPRPGLAFACILALVSGCAEPLVHQRGLAALHTRAATTCKTKPAQCAPLAPCSSELRQALRGWQGVNEALAKGEDGAAQTADALISEGTARLACIAAGVK